MPHMTASGSINEELHAIDAPKIWLTRLFQPGTAANQSSANQISPSAAIKSKSLADQAFPNHAFLVGTIPHGKSRFSGFEVQPNVRARWSIDDRQTVWASAARAVRTPSRLDQDAVSDIRTLPTAPLPTLLQFRGDPDFKSEELLALDVGYRVQPSDSVSIDIAGFTSRWHS